MAAQTRSTATVDTTAKDITAKDITTTSAMSLASHRSSTHPIATSGNDRTRSMRLEPTQVASELEAGGLTPTIDESTLPYQYIVTATRP